MGVGAFISDQRGSRYFPSRTPDVEQSYKDGQTAAPRAHACLEPTGRGARGAP